MSTIFTSCRGLWEVKPGIRSTNALIRRELALKRFRDGSIKCGRDLKKFRRDLKARKTLFVEIPCVVFTQPEPEERKVTDGETSKSTTKQARRKARFRLAKAKIAKAPVDETDKVIRYEIAEVIPPSVMVLAVRETLRHLTVTEKTVRPKLLKENQLNLFVAEIDAMVMGGPFWKRPRLPSNPVRCSHLRRDYWLTVGSPVFEVVCREGCQAGRTFYCLRNHATTQVEFDTYTYVEYVKTIPGSLLGRVWYTFDARRSTDE